ncbi:hypothetical protein ANCDUO_01953 [Ancylostoma duodenale]|uniref:ATP-dependent DNA helicase n=1 Tax=Ancylostoma duodenale TaxID=51022 RepID=A0A0C2H1R2_9BILA|nr:hypothetical protein ANCDUO_01953 [Ancylostoma duodenale]
MTRLCSLAKELIKLDVVIWDEAPMAPKPALEAVDKMLRDITQIDLIFGNKIMLPGGDFRQVLPVPGSTVIYKSVDSVVIEDLTDMLNFPAEFLNTVTPVGFLSHELRIKIGWIVMLLRNLNLKKGLCNGTTLSVVQTGERVFGCIFACGSGKGRYVLIPRFDNYYLSDFFRHYSAMLERKSYGQSCNSLRFLKAGNNKMGIVDM